MKIYSKVTLNVLLLKKLIDDEKTFYFFDRFFVSNQNFTTEHVKIIKNYRFFLCFQVKWQPCKSINLSLTINTGFNFFYANNPA